MYQLMRDIYILKLLLLGNQSCPQQLYNLLNIFHDIVARKNLIREKPIYFHSYSFLYSNLKLRENFLLFVYKPVSVKKLNNGVKFQTSNLKTFVLF